MTTTIRAAVTVLSLACVSAASAAETDSAPGAIQFAQAQGVIVQDVQPLAPAQRGQSVDAGATPARQRVWLFPPFGNYLNNR